MLPPRSPTRPFLSKNEPGGCARTKLGRRASELCGMIVLSRVLLAPATPKKKPQDFVGSSEEQQEHHQNKHHESRQRKGDNCVSLK